MSNKTVVQPSFAIRFKPSSVRDDDIDDDDTDDTEYEMSPGGDPLTCRLRKKTVLFERQTLTPGSSTPLSDSADVAENNSVSLPPSTLPLSKSIPGSELSSPTSNVNNISTPSSSAAATGGDEKTTSGGKIQQQTTTEKVSLFSGLREKLDRLSAESKEMFDRKMRRSGSADAAKITALLNGTDVTNCESSKCVEMTDLTDADLPDTNTTVGQVHKSASAAQMSKKDKFYTTDSPTRPKSASVSTELNGLPECVAMSELLSTCSDEGQEAEAVKQTMESTQSPFTESCNSTIDSKHTTATRQNSKYMKLYGFFSRLQHLLTNINRRNVVAVVVALLAYALIPLPPYMSGLVTGVLLSTAAFIIYQRITTSLTAKQHVLIHNIQSLPVAKPNIKQSKNTEKVFKGWMNELNRYDVTDFHINQTYSVLVTLEGCTLRLQTPKHGIPKRAICDEILPAVSFVRQRHFDLRGTRVILLPRDLCSKRLWSKKYPVCIEVERKKLSIDSSSIESMQHKTTECTTTLYLFARTSRQKEEWYRRFVCASRGCPWPTRLDDVLPRSATGSNLSSVVQGGSVTGGGSPSSTGEQPVMTWQKQHHRAASTDSTGSSDSLNAPSVAPTPTGLIDYSLMSPDDNLAEYLKYMASVLPASDVVQTDTPVDDNSDQPSLCWLNALISRCFLDFLREKYWVEKMRDKIQKKLCKMHVPHFINKLTVTGIELGSSVPSIQRASEPYLDDRGLWIDLDVAYTGGFCISMETKCNLMKLKQSSSVSTLVNDAAAKDKRSAVTDSDEEDSAESTTDEESVEDNTNKDPADDRRPEPMGKKLLRFVDKISQSRYFQQATEYKYIKKAMEEVSNTRLVLNVEMCSVTGILAVNVPPPPTDRIWYGFRSNPDLVLSAKPRVGEREVSLSPVTDWIEKKLAIEFQRVFVMPNMDDFPISLMCAHVLQPTQKQQQQQSPSELASCSPQSTADDAIDALSSI